MLQIRRLKRNQVDEALLKELNRLWLQLAPKREPLKLEWLKAIVRQKFYYLAVVRERSGPPKIIAMGSIHFVRDFPGLIAYIGNVVVDANYRSKGVGTKLENYLVTLAIYKGAKFIEATSSDKHAPGFWLKRGWERRDTNVFRKYLKYL